MADETTPNADTDATNPNPNPNPAPAPANTEVTKRVEELMKLTLDKRPETYQGVVTTNGDILKRFLETDADARAAGEYIGRTAAGRCYFMTAAIATRLRRFAPDAEAKPRVAKLVSFKDITATDATAALRKLADEIAKLAGSTLRVPGKATLIDALNGSVDPQPMADEYAKAQWPDVVKAAVEKMASIKAAANARKPGKAAREAIATLKAALSFDVASVAIGDHAKLAEATTAAQTAYDEYAKVSEAIEAMF